MRHFQLTTIAALMAVSGVIHGANITSGVSLFYLVDIDGTIGLNLSPDSDDVNFLLAAPTLNSYFAVGFGDSMKDTLILVAYKSEDGKRVTVSPRLATGYTEPPYYSGAAITLDSSSSVDGGKFVVKGTCKNCRNWPGGSLDAKSTSQGMSFAVGPHVKLQSDDLGARVRRHVKYGKFTMNMKQATGPGGLDALNTSDVTTTTGSERNGDTLGDTDIIRPIHGYILAVAAIVVAPLDLVVAHAIPTHIKWHVTLSVLYLIMVLGGLALGAASLSNQAIKTQNFDTPHQILGFVATGLICVIFLFGLFTKRIFRPNSVRHRPPPLVYYVHTWGARLIWMLLLVTGGLGLALADEKKRLKIAYSVLAVASVVITVVILGAIDYRARKRIQSEEVKRIQGRN